MPKKIVPAMSIKIAAKAVLGGGDGRAGKLTRNLGIVRFNSGMDDRSSSWSGDDDRRIEEISLYFFIFSARFGDVRRGACATERSRQTAANAMVASFVVGKP